MLSFGESILRIVKVVKFNIENKEGFLNVKIFIRYVCFYIYLFSLGSSNYKVIKWYI